MKVFFFTKAGPTVVLRIPLWAAGILMFGGAMVFAADPPPFRTLFSNDLTNVTTCVSPYHRAGEVFSREGLWGSVDETAGTGIDVHLLQPGTGWVPLWKSRVLPFEENFRWHQERYGVASPFDDYLTKGGDVVADFVQRCREKKLVPFISIRMNDHHRTDYIDFSREEAQKAGQPQSIYASKWYHDHPEYRLTQYCPIPPQGNLSSAAYRKKFPAQVRVNHLLDWAIPAVRQQKFDFIREICENYDIDGIELDFVRFPFFFRQETSLEDRRDIMSAFVRRVREVLDRTTGDGRRRWLDVRVPAWIEGVGGLEQCGLDLRRLKSEGVDMFNLACDYVTEQVGDLARIRALIPDASLYREMSHLVHRYALPGQKSVYRTATDEQLFTTAHLAYRRGAVGISTFNLVYYRDHEERPPADISEPPFALYKILRDPELVARQPQHYFLSRHDMAGRPVFGQQFGGQNIQPVVWHATPSVTEYRMDMSPPSGGWRRDGRLRVQLDRSWPNALPQGDEVMIRFNGRLLEQTKDVSEPYPTKFSAGLGRPDELRAWIVPVKELRDGLNTIELVAPRGCDGKIIFIDLAVK